jgi:hypothetical protein
MTCISLKGLLLLNAYEKKSLMRHHDAAHMCPATKLILQRLLLHHVQCLVNHG